MANILGQVMSAAQSAANQPLPSRGRQPEDKIAAENRAAARKRLETALAENNKPELEALLPAAQQLGVDTSMFETAAGIETPEQQLNRNLIEGLARKLTGGTPQADTAIGQPPDLSLAPRPSGVEVAGPPRPPQEVTEVPAQENVFDSDLMTNLALKKFFNIGIGQNPFENEQWFTRFGERVNAGMPVSQAVNETSVEFGFVPDGASNLKDLASGERDVLFGKSFSTHLSDPVLEQVLAQAYPKQVDAKTGKFDEKTKAAILLDSMEKQGHVIPERYRPIIDHFRGLDTPEGVLLPEVEQHAYLLFNKPAWALSDTEANYAKKDFDNDQIILKAKQITSETVARMKAGFELEPEKPISAEDRGKFGIGSAIPTYQDLADRGVRFPTEFDRKSYFELSQIRTDMDEMGEFLFGTKKRPKDGIFTGIETNFAKRKLAQGGLIEDTFVGNARGRNYELYKDKLAAMTRRLIALAGESGGRFTNEDVAQVMRSAPDVGGFFGAPDSEINARRKFDSFMVKLGQMLSNIESKTVVNPIGQPEVEGTVTNEAPKLDKLVLVKGKIYVDAQGNQKKYLGQDAQGENQWQTVK